MSVPSFRTNETDIETQAQAEIILWEFILEFNRRDLFRAAEAYFRERAPGSSVYTFRNMEGGLMRLVIDLIIQASVDSIRNNLGGWVGQTLMDRYRFTAESIPPRMLVREAVAVRVRLQTVLADLERELANSYPYLMREIEEAAEHYESPEAAYLMSDEEADRVIRLVCL